MFAAIPKFGTRVSPRCLFSETMLIVEVEDGEVLSSREHWIGELSDDGLLDELVELGVDTLVCGGVTREFLEDAGICGVKVINNVAGELDEILEALRKGCLVPGYGIDKDQLKAGQSR